jgi:hypothetical protein
MAQEGLSLEKNMKPVQIFHQPQNVLFIVTERKLFVLDV